MAATGGHIKVRSLLGLQIVTGVVVPLLTIARLAIVIRSARERKAHGVGVTSKYVGEVFLVLVAVLNTSETVMWGWNCMEEINSGMAAVDGAYLQRTFWASVFYVVHLWSLKGAFLSLYYDLIPTLGRKTRWLLYVATLVAVTSFQGVLTAQMTFCRPISTNWSTGPDFCSHITSKCWIMISSITNIGAGLLIFAIPFCIISTLQLGQRERYGFMAIYAIGLLSVLASVLRFLVLRGDHNTAFSPTSTTDLDSDWRNSLHSIVFWSTIELLSAHICICIPAFRLFLRKSKRTGVCGERCESRETARNIPAIATLGNTNTGGDWFDYSVVSPLEGPDAPSLQARLEEGGDMGWDRRSWGIGRKCETFGVLEASVGDQDIGGGNGYRRRSTMGEAGSGDVRKIRGSLSIPCVERASSEV